MAKEFAARKDDGWKVVGIAPDMCFTPGLQPPIPYPVTSKLGSSSQVVKTVHLNNKPAFVYNQSKVPTTIGDAAGKNKGVVSGTVEGDCWPIEHSPDTYVGGKPVVRVGDMFHMNGSAGGGGRSGLSKAERWEQRKKIIEEGENSNDPKKREAAERLERNNTGVEKAKLADHVYEPRDPSKPMPEPPEGWKDISDDPNALEKYGLKPKDLKAPEGSPDFRARVYEPDPNVFGKDMSATVTFRGTSSSADWGQNLNQGLNMKSSYYGKAVGIGNQINKPGNAPIDIAGHSLGGGLASAASRAGGSPAWTFNAAGLHSNTTGRYGGINPPVPKPDNIHAYRVNGEVLTMLQEHTLAGMGIVMGTGGAIGGLIGGGVGVIAGSLIGGLAKLGLASAIPSSVGTKHDLSGGHGNPVSRHFTDQVIDCIEMEKDADIATITSR